MKKQLIIYLLITVLVNGLFAQSKTSFNTYSAVNMNNVSSPQGAIIFKVYSLGKNVTEARERAQRDAVHAIIFQGISGSRYPNPMISDPSDLTNDSKYWKGFFGVKDLVSGKPDKKVNALYLNYVKVPLNYTIDPKDKKQVGGKESVGIVVEVAYDNLRERLETDGKVKKLGF